jgi:hypothetical protein
MLAPSEGEEVRPEATFISRLLLIFKLEDGGTSWLRLFALIADSPATPVIKLIQVCEPVSMTIPAVGASSTH